MANTGGQRLWWIRWQGGVVDRGGERGGGETSFCNACRGETRPWNHQDGNHGIINTIHAVHTNRIGAHHKLGQLSFL